VEKSNNVESWRYLRLSHREVAVPIPRLNRMCPAQLPTNKELAMTGMADLTRWPDDDVFGKAGEQPGSQMSYYRDIEIKRRLYILQRQALEGQIEAIQEQRNAIQEQRNATRLQKEAIVEMRTQSRYLLWSVVGVFATALITLAVSLIH
jgi:hypothetical protein